MKFIGEYLLTFLLFGAAVYILLPLLSKRQYAKDVRMNKSLWAAILFTAVKVILDYINP